MDGLVENDQRLNPSNPFDEDALSFQVNKPVDVAQLADEIKKALDVPRVVISSQATMIEGQRILFVAPVLNEDSVAAVIDDHVKDSNWGKVEGLEEALTKLRSGATLSTKEISIVMRATLL